MKKLFKLLSVLSVSASLFFVSCKGEPGKDGLPGPAGTQGPPGKDAPLAKDGKDGAPGLAGNANVKSYTHTAKVADWKETDVAGIGNGVTSKWGSIAITNADVTTDKFIFLFVKSGTQLKALPIVYTKELDNSVERLDYGYKTGQVEIYYRNQTSLFGPAGPDAFKPIKDIDFEYVVASKSPASLVKAGVNVKNYNEVVNYLGQND